MTKCRSKTRPAKKIVRRDVQGIIVEVYDSVRHAASGFGKFTAKQLYNHLYFSGGLLFHGYFWEWYENAAGGVSEQRCLGTDCEKKFISRGKGNRFCPSCLAKDVFHPAAHKIHLSK